MRWSFRRLRAVPSLICSVVALPASSPRLGTVPRGRDLRLGDGGVVRAPAGPLRGRRAYSRRCNRRLRAAGSVPEPNQTATTTAASTHAFVSCSTLDDEPPLRACRARDVR